MPRADAVSKPSRFIAFATVGVIVAGLYFAREVLVPVAVALLLTFLLAPLVHRLEHLHVPRIPAVLISVAFSFAILGSIGWLISNQASDLAVKIGSYQSDIDQKIQRLHRYFGHGAIADASRALDQMAKDVATSQPAVPSDSASWLNRGTPQNPLTVELNSVPETNNTLKSIGDALQFIAPMAQSLVIIVFVIFMLIQREDIRDRLIRLVGHGRLSLTTRALDDASTRISRYLLAQSSINGSFGIVVGIGLYLIHIPNAPLWGLLCALLRFIPYLGVWVGAIFPIILSFVVPDGYYAARPFLTIGLFVVTELTAANIFEPLLFSSSTGVSPLAILVAAVFWTWLWGGIGLLMSTPLTVLLAVAGKYVPQLEFLDVLLGDQPVLSPPERYYQRLLADDPEEAEDILEDFEKTRTVEQVYGEIMLPALQMTERDHDRGVLDDEQRNIIAQLMREQVEALHEPIAQAPVAGQAAPFIPKDTLIRVVCLPAQNPADEIAGLMLVNLLNRQGYTASIVSADSLVSERVDAIATLKADLVIVSSMPPGAIIHARYLCKLIRNKYPDIQLLVAVWSREEKLERLKKRLGSGPAIALVGEFPSALSAINQLAQPLLIRAEEATKSLPPTDPLPQTASAG